MREHHVTIYGASPTLHTVLLDEPSFAETNLRYVVSGGEPLTIDIQRRFHQQSSALLCNCYGPTETTIDATFWLSPQAADPQPAPIGRPVPNAQAYVLDRQLRPVPIGAIGELYIGGAGLALGYLHRPDLTAERFVPNPFATQPGARLYRTGDLARFRPDGNIEFLGRADTQVKIRGFRIEPGEIESALRQHPAIAEAAVVVHEHATGDKRLVAYIVENQEPRTKNLEPNEQKNKGTKEQSTIDQNLEPSTKHQGTDENNPSPLACRNRVRSRPRFGEGAGGEGLAVSLRSFLRERLPEYMVPAAFVPLDALPLTPSGKLDRRALPAPDTAHVAVGPQEAPQTELERTIAEIWRALLAIETVGREDNFFDLGGHSLLMVQARHRLIAALGREIAMVDLFRYPTIRALAGFLGGEDKAPSASLAPSQERAARRRELLAAPPEHQETSAAPAFDREIAVVGLSGRFPGAPDIDTFWRNLCDGVESIALFSEQELLESGISPALLAQPGYVRAGGALDNIDLFDAAFFGYSPREAEIMDPQQRLFLECAWTALEHAGYAPDNIAVPTGVYAGVSLNRYWLNLASNLDLVEALGSFHTVMSNDRDFLTTRISYKLNLHGPSLNIQTACSTSLVAVHTACQALLHHECDMALAGGVSIAVPTKSGYLYQEGGIHSPDGHCRAFDARAQGTVGGSGMGVVVLKRLSSALHDGDQIYAVIKGSALNNDGAQKVGYTAPSVEGQARVIAEALATAGVEPETISYVETHGTATALGDPIEVAALTEAYRAGTDKTGFCALGSVKTNIGHLDAAAGVAGLIKAVLSLKHGQIPASLHYETPNPAIDFASSPFYVNNKLTAWQPAGQPRRAGVSSFGIGGTNAHVVLEEAPAIAESTPTNGWQILLLSAKTGSALDAATENLTAYLREHPETELADIAYTLQVGRSAFNHRRVLVCRDHGSAAQALSSRDAQQVFTRHHAAEARSVAFMFPGGGGQHVRMAQELYASQPIFHEWIDRCAELLAPSLQLDIRSLIFPAEDQVASAAQQLRQTDLALPALFAIEYGLAQLWMSWGVKPSAMIGHSLGEYVAACLAGVFTLEDALALVTARGKLMMQLPAGMMLSIALPEAELRAKLQPGLAIAAINAPALCVVSGAAQAVIEFEQALRAEGIDCRRVPIDVAAHSPLVEPILDEFARCVESLRLNPPQIPCISGMSGSWLTAAEATDPRYWVRHLRQTVRFADGIAALLKDSQPILLEVGPGRALSSAARLQASAERDVSTLTSLPSQHDQQSDAAFLLTTLGRLWLAGVAIDWQAWHAPARRLRLALPTYPFDRRRYWIDAQPAAGRDLLPVVHADPRDWLYAPSWKRALPPRRARPDELAQRRWLVFSDNCGIGDRLVQRLDAAGQSVTTVRIGQAFSQDSTDSYTLCPERLEGYEQLLQSLQAAGRLPHTIVHLWNVTPERVELPTIERVKVAQARGLYSLIFLAQALGNHAAAESIRLGVVSNQLYRVTGDEQIAPEKTMILAACKSIPQEYPQITCRSLDVRLDAEPVSEQIIAELAGEPTSGEVAYRGGHHWQPTFEPILADPGDETRLRDRGVYLITGGLGGVGLVLAEHLAQRVQAKLILTGRSALPEREGWAAWLAAHPLDDPTSRKIAALQRIESLGAEVLPLSADVADLDQMRAAVAAAEQRFGPIHGVIHAAGVAGGGMIQYRKPDEIAQSLAPKVQGALVLDAVFAERPLDFLALCSSLNAIAGGFGLVDYCAANIYLDSFAQARQSAAEQYTVSINWDLWRGVGMAARPRLASGLAAENHASRTGMEPQQGSEIFERILADGRLPQVVVSRIEPRALQEQALHFNRTAVMAALEQMQAPQLDTLPAPHSRRELPTEYVAPRSELEAQIARIWEQLLGVAQIGVHDNFFELGGHSLLAIQLVAQLRAQCQAEVSLHTLFEAPTIGQLAERIGGSAEQSQQARTIEEMLHMVEHLSDDEVAALLGQSEGTTLP
ncbi:MAG TPA: SDR family NAD(P)-dependent oxidoreductase [Herpetosiphonaceae bacterium]